MREKRSHKHYVVSGTLCPISDLVIFDGHGAAALEGPITYGTESLFETSEASKSLSEASESYSESSESLP